MRTEKELRLDDLSLRERERERERKGERERRVAEDAVEVDQNIRNKNINFKRVEQTSEPWRREVERVNDLPRRRV
jgi:hypothetical protein